MQRRGGNPKGGGERLLKVVCECLHPVFSEVAVEIGDHRKFKLVACSFRVLVGFVIGLLFSTEIATPLYHWLT